MSVIYCEVIEEPRPWSMYDIILAKSLLQKRLLDIGCGTVMKILPLARNLQYIVGLEPNERMYLRA